MLERERLERVRDTREGFGEEEDSEKREIEKIETDIRERTEEREREREIETERRDTHVRKKRRDPRIRAKKQFSS